MFSSLRSHSIDQLFHLSQFLFQGSTKIFSDPFHCAVGELLVVIGRLFDFLKLFQRDSIVLVYLQHHLFPCDLDFVKKGVPCFFKFSCYSVYMVKIGPKAAFMLVKDLFVSCQYVGVGLQVCIVLLKMANVVFLKQSEVLSPLFYFV